MSEKTKDYRVTTSSDMHSKIEMLLMLARRALRVGAGGYVAMYVDGDGDGALDLGSYADDSERIAEQAIGKNNSPFGGGYGIAKAIPNGAAVYRGEPKDRQLTVTVGDDVVVDRAGMAHRIIVNGIEYIRCDEFDKDEEASD